MTYTSPTGAKFEVVNHFDLTGYYECRCSYNCKSKFNPNGNGMVIITEAFFKTLKPC